MTNWNSKERKYTKILSDDVIAKAQLARSMRQEGIPVKIISTSLQLSTSRIYEYLREDFLAPPKPPTRQFHI